MTLKTITLAAALGASLLGGVARAEEPSAPPEPTQTQTGERQRPRDGSGAGAQRRQGAGERAGACDGTMRRDRLRDGRGGGMGAGGRGGRMGTCGKR